ncbi:MAG: nicotinate-nucleotide--dimethylbenzimidazole phosphoribosyltransferase, partial [Methylovirgula sp.]
MPQPKLVSPRSFADIRALLADLPGPSEACAAAARSRQAELTKPSGSLGRLEEIAEFLAAWQGRAMPSLD